MYIPRVWWSIILCVNNAFGFMQHELLPYDPVPKDDAIVLFEGWRITVLTPWLFRISDVNADNRPTLAVVHRNLPVPVYAVDANSDGVVVKTNSVHLHVTKKSMWGKNLDSGQTWNYTSDVGRNLLGTIRTLDTLGPTNLNCTKFTPEAHCEWGLVSRDGWAVLNDTISPRLSNDWWSNETIPHLDMYLFFHGLNYKQAVSDYSKIGGKIPMPPRYMFGVLWTRWYDYDSIDVRELVGGFETRGLPLDMLILDMNWHKKPWWGGYTFDDRLFPNPQKMVNAIHKKGVSIGLNIHDCLLSEPGCPAGTLSPDDGAVYDAFVSATNTPSGSNIPLNLNQSEFALLKEDLAIKPFEQLADMWWIDWQQGEFGGGLIGGRANPTIWLNKLRYTNRKRWSSNVRGSVLSRFGGLGSHRYGVGFSGDVQMLDWENLSFQPFFTATGANVLFSSWSHDITGPNRDPELFVRWTQWGAFSGILRFHERGMSSGPCAFTSFPLPSSECANVDLWANLPVRFANILHATMQIRQKWVPYMYSSAIVTFQTGIPWIRPLYYEFPTVENAYTYGNQYMFGDLVTVAPIVEPSDPQAPTATEWEIWVPPGLWYSPNDDALVMGDLNTGTSYKRYWDLAEVPMLFQAGSVLPQRFLDKQVLGMAKRAFTDLEFIIVPGADVGSGTLFEDDGETTMYLDGEIGRIELNYTKSHTVVQTRVETRLRAFGEFSKSIPERTIRLVFPGIVAMGECVVHNNTTTVVVEYDGTTLTGMVKVGWNLRSVLLITCNISNTNVSGIKGAIAHTRMAKSALDEVVLTPGSHPCWHGAPCGYRPQDDNLITLASIGDRLEYALDPTELIKEIIKRHRECVQREITVENILRVDTLWAPTQGGWPEATRLRVNYAVTMVYWSMDQLCGILIMPLVCAAHATEQSNVSYVVQIPDAIFDYEKIPEKAVTSKGVASKRQRTILWRPPFRPETVFVFVNG